MPIYEYVCLSCKKQTEAIQKFSDAPLIECKICKGALKKIMSKTSFQLKGSGWYASDYKKSASAPVAESEKAGETNAKEEKSAEAKPAEAQSSLKSVAVEPVKLEKSALPASVPKKD